MKLVDVDRLMSGLMFILEDYPPFEKIYLSRDGTIFGEHKGQRYNLNINIYDEAKFFDDEESLGIHLSIMIRELADVLIPFNFLKDKSPEEILYRIRYVEREDDIRYHEFPEVEKGIRGIYIIDCDGYEGLLKKGLLHMLRNNSGFVITPEQLEEIRDKEYR